MKIKLSKAIFIASFLPYLLVLIYGIIGAFQGISLFYNNVYGVAGFLYTILFVLCRFTLEIPIIPILIIYQICYLIRNKVKKIKEIDFNKFVVICIVVGLAVIIPLFISYHSFEIDQSFEKSDAKKMSKNAEEKISYNENKTYYSGIFGMKEYTHDHIFIDYDKNEVGILCKAGYDEFWKVKLNKTSKNSYEYKHIINDYIMQANIPLNNPGKQLISFYENKNKMNCTIAFLLIYQDGIIYYADNIKEKDTGYTRYTGLDSSKYFVGKNIKYTE